MKYFVILDINNRIISSRTDSKNRICDGEIEVDSDFNPHGMVYNPEAGTLTTYVPTPEELEEKQKQEQLACLEKEMEHALKFSTQAEIDRIKQEYADINNGVACKTKSEVEAERDAAVIDANKWFGVAMRDKGWW